VHGHELLSTLAGPTHLSTCPLLLLMLAQAAQPTCCKLPFSRM
jgi:hypothetical protein